MIFPETGFLHLPQIIGDPKATPPYPGHYSYRKVLVVRRNKVGYLSQADNTQKQDSRMAC